MKKLLSLLTSAVLSTSFLPASLLANAEDNVQNKTSSHTDEPLFTIPKDKGAELNAASYMPSTGDVKVLAVALNFLDYKLPDWTVPNEDNEWTGGYDVCLAAAEEEPVKAESSVSYNSIEDAAVELRQKMVARQNKVTIYFDANENDALSVANEIYEKALKHTGVPNEGDYLRSSVYSVDINAKQYFIGNGIYVINYSLTYFADREQEAIAVEKMNSILGEMYLSQKSDLEKITAIYDYICSNIAYDYEHKDDADYLLKHSPYAALIDGKAVCQAYAMINYYMLLSAGIDARIITGDAGCFLEMFENYEPHAWNIVKLGECYYNTDPTWDAGNEVYSYFLKSDETFNDDVMNGHCRRDTYKTEAFYESYPMTEKDHHAETFEISGICGDDL